MAVTDLNALESLYFAALQKPAADRRAFLETACGGEAELQSRVERLLAAQANIGDFMESPSNERHREAAGEQTHESRSPSATADLPRRDELVGSSLTGKYKLVELIGEGGMGQVFMAQQAEPVRRAVAIKVIKAGMDSKAV